MGSEKEAAAGYGEGDIEAKAMEKGAASPAGKGAEPPPTPPADALVQAAGTTETDIAGNIREKTARASKN